MQRIWPAGVVLVSLFIISCSSEEVQIRATKEHTIRSLLSPHVEPSITLIVGTNKIHDVVGHAPYYLQIPQWNSVFVATESKDHHFYYHVVDLKDCLDTVIDGHGTSFGYWIGIRNGMSDECISKVGAHQLTVSRKGDKRQISYLLDLKEKRAVSMRIEDLDSNGKVVGGTVNEVK